MVMYVLGEMCVIAHGLTPFSLQMGENPFCASYSVLAGLDRHVGRGHCDHRPGPSMQAHPRDELVERGAPVRDL